MWIRVFTGRLRVVGPDVPFILPPLLELIECLRRLGKERELESRTKEYS